MFQSFSRIALRAAFSAVSSSAGAATVAVPALVAASDSLSSAWASTSSSSRLYSEAAAEPNQCRTFGMVPPGHAESDLSPNVCNIGLGRRRDLTLRQDLCLYGKDGAKASLGDVLKVGLSMLHVIQHPCDCMEMGIMGQMNMAPNSLPTLAACLCLHALSSTHISD
jgi:hypothetical protein